jgi:hypothetical protein
VLDFVLFGLPSMGFGLDLLIQGQTTGVLNVISIFLAWIGGTLVFGFAPLMHGHTADVQVSTANDGNPVEKLLARH